MNERQCDPALDVKFISGRVVPDLVVGLAMEAIYGAYNASAHRRKLVREREPFTNRPSCSQHRLKRQAPGVGRPHARAPLPERGEKRMAHRCPGLMVTTRRGASALEFPLR